MDKYDALVEEAKTLIGKASLGPWRHRAGEDVVQQRGPDGNWYHLLELVSFEHNQDDLAFAARARTMIPELVAALTDLLELATLVQAGRLNVETLGQHKDVARNWPRQLARAEQVAAHYATEAILRRWELGLDPDPRFEGLRSVSIAEISSRPAQAFEPVPPSREILRECAQKAVREALDAEAMR